MSTWLLDGFPAEVTRQLRERGADLAQIAALIAHHSGDAVLLTGSYASGEANPTSDLDLLVLTRREQAGQVTGMVNHPSLLGDSFDGRAGDLVVNVEYVLQQRLADISRIVATAAAADPPALPNLQGLELRLVHRVTTGVVLAGDGVLRECRAMLDADVVRASAAALAFVGALSLLEDTTVLPSPEREVMRRSAGESLLMSAVTAAGPLTYDVKHLLSRAARLATQPGAPRALTEREQLLFADRLSQADGLRFILDLAEDLYQSFSGPSCPTILLRMLAPFRPGWAWTGRAFPARDRSGGTA
jgi:predicted nucleotidyltransferase